MSSSESLLVRSYLTVSNYKVSITSTFLKETDMESITGSTTTASYCISTNHVYSSAEQD